MTKRERAGRRGRTSIEVPDFAEKLEYLLRRLGRSQKWLTGMLLDPHGQGPIPSSITGWKKRNILPSDYVASFCQIFSIDEEILVEPDFDKFERTVEPDRMIGSGIYWKRLLESAITSNDGLHVIKEGEPLPRALANVVFGEGANPRLVKRHQHIPLDASIRFALSASATACIADSAAQIMLFCEDRKGWEIVAPHRHDPGFVMNGNHWLLPASNRSAMKLKEPMGLYRAVALVVASPPRDEQIRSELLNGRMVWATDALASWIFKEQIDFRMYQTEFLVIAPLRR